MAISEQTRKAENAELKWVLEHTRIRLYATGVPQTRDIDEAHSFVYDEDQWVPSLLDLASEFPLAALRGHMEELLISEPYHMHAVLPYPRYHTGVGLAGFVPTDPATRSLAEGAPPTPDEVHIMTIERLMPEEGEDEEDEDEMVEYWMKTDVARRVGLVGQPFADILRQVETAIVNYVLPIYRRRKIANAALLTQTELPTAVIENVLNSYVWDYQRRHQK